MYSLSPPRYDAAPRAAPALPHAAHARRPLSAAHSACAAALAKGRRTYLHNPPFLRRACQVYADKTSVNRAAEEAISNVLARPRTWRTPTPCTVL